MSVAVKNIISNQEASADDCPRRSPDFVFWTSRNGQLGLQLLYTAEAVHYRPHTHPEYNFTICLAGEISSVQLGRKQAIGRGGIVISNPGVEHSCGYRPRGHQGCEILTLSLDRRFIAALAPEFGLPAPDRETSLAFTGTLQSLMSYDCAQTLAAELRESRPGRNQLIEALATRLVVECLRVWPRPHIRSVATDTVPRLPRKDFVRAYEFMRRCPKENFRLQHLSQFLGSSEERFTRLFQASTQTPPAAFYNQLLLERAQGLLRNTGLSVKEIGYQLGFKTSSHFTAAFRRTFGMSPQTYRRKAIAIPAECWADVPPAAFPVLAG